MLAPVHNLQLRPMLMGICCFCLFSRAEGGGGGVGVFVLFFFLGGGGGGGGVLGFGP